MGRTFPFFGIILHTETSPSNTKERLLLGEFPAIPVPLRVKRGEAEGLRRKEFLVPMLDAHLLEAERDCAGFGL